jgi:hypothetical protein
MSNTNGACPKLASTTSPGVCNPTVGYRFGYEKRTQIFKEYGQEYYCQNTYTYYNKETFFMAANMLFNITQKHFYKERPILFQDLWQYVYSVSLSKSYCVALPTLKVCLSH